MFTAPFLSLNSSLNRRTKPRGHNNQKKKKPTRPGSGAVPCTARCSRSCSIYYWYYWRECSRPETDLCPKGQLRYSSCCSLDCSQPPRPSRKTRRPLTDQPSSPYFFFFSLHSTVSSCLCRRKQSPAPPFCAFLKTGACAFRMDYTPGAACIVYGCTSCRQGAYSRHSPDSGSVCIRQRPRGLS